MRIGLFSDNYLPATNGVVYMVESIRRNLEDMGHTVYVVAPKKGLRDQKNHKNVIWIPAIEGVFFDDQLTSLFFPNMQYRKIARLKLDVIMFFTPGQIGLFGAYCAIKLGTPLVSQYCTDLSEYIERYPATIIGVAALTFSAPFMLKLSLRETHDVSRSIMGSRAPNLSRRQHLVEKMHKVLHDQCSAVVAVSDKTAKQLSSWKSSAPIHTIPTGIDALPYDPEESRAFRKKFGLKDQDKIIMYVGRLAHEKNLDLLIKAFKFIGKTEPNCKLVFVGDYMYREMLERHASKSPYSDRIIFTGRYPREHLGSVYKIADIFLFPSLTDTQALVVNEAAHAGLPFVWVDKDLNRVLVDGKTGLKAKNDAKDFAQKVISLLNDETKLNKFGIMSKRLAVLVDEKHQATKLAKLFKSLISQNPKI